jgi:hypothetical protein
LHHTYRWLDQFLDLLAYEYKVRLGFVVLTAVVIEGFCLLGYYAAYSVERQPTFRRNMSPPSSGSKNKLRNKHQTASRAYMFLRNVGWLSTDYTALYPRR